MLISSTGSSEKYLTGNYRSQKPSKKKVNNPSRFKKFVITLLVVFVQSGLINAQGNPDFYLHENGVTVICTDAEVGDTGEANGVTYTK
jgi:hypothetical protein